MTMPNLEMLKTHLRVTHDYDDALIAEMLAAATSRAEAFICMPLHEFEGTLPHPIVQAIYLFAEANFDGRGNESGPELEGMAERMLRPYRRETGVRAA
ncbi:head-tail connector protein [Luteimonas sp. e5]